MHTIDAPSSQWSGFAHNSDHARVVCSISPNLFVFARKCHGTWPLSLPLAPSRITILSSVSYIIIWIYCRNTTSSNKSKIDWSQRGNGTLRAKVIAQRHKILSTTATVPFALVWDTRKTNCIQGCWTQLSRPPGVQFSACVDAPGLLVAVTSTMHLRAYVLGSSMIIIRISWRWALGLSVNQTVTSCFRLYTRYMFRVGPTLPCPLRCREQNALNCIMKVYCSCVLSHTLYTVKNNTNPCEILFVHL
jgi:hypothetical protein